MTGIEGMESKKHSLLLFLEPQDSLLTGTEMESTMQQSGKLVELPLIQATPIIPTENNLYIYSQKKRAKFLIGSGSVNSLVKKAVTNRR